MDDDWLQEHPAFRDLPAPSDASSGAPKELMTIHRGELYVWNDKEAALVCCNLKDLQAEKTNVCTILCGCVPSSPIDRVVMNVTGRHVALVSATNVWVIDMPSIEARHFRENAKLRARSFPVGERFFESSTVSNRIQQVRWHPDSQADIHLTILTSDNTLRIFNMLNPASAEMQIFLGGDSQSVLSHWKPSYGLSDSESVVDFDFGPIENLPVFSGFVKMAHTEAVHTVFILKENGDVHLLYPRLNQPKCPVFLSEPLTVHPPAEDNYGVDACSVVCLESNPCVLVIGSAAGNICHSLVLNDEDQDEDAFPKKKRRCVFEIVELELADAELGGHDDDGDEGGVQLYADPLVPYRYHVCHSSGLHMVTLLWLESLKRFCGLPEEDAPDALGQFVPSKIEQNVSTRASPDADALKIIGLSMTTDRAIGTILFCLTSKPECIAIRLVSHLVPSLPLLQSDRQERSPMRQLESKDFLHRITKLLQSSKPPVLKSGRLKEGGSSQQELFQLLIEYTQMFRMEITKLETVKDEICKRAVVLSKQKQHQTTDLDKLERAREGIEMKAIEIEKKSRAMQERQEKLSLRGQRLLRLLERQQCVESFAEKKYSENLSSIAKRVENLKSNFEQVKIKITYSRKERLYEESDVSLSSGQTKRIRQILQENRQLLGHTRDQLKQLQTDSGL